MNSDDFWKKARSFAKVNPDLCFVINTNPDRENKVREENAYTQWVEYLQSMGLKTTAATFKRIHESGMGKALTVPTEYPGQFDSVYTDSSRRRSW